MTWSSMAIVGRIARAHGNKGQVIVNLETDFPEQRFQPGAELFVQRRGQVERIRVTTVRFQQNRPVIGIDGVVTMNDAEALADLELLVPRETLAALPDGMYYHHDLVGCRVATFDGVDVGVVTGVEEAAGRSRLIVDREGRELLIPLATEICTTVDVAGKRIVITPPGGLLELNDREP